MILIVLAAVTVLAVLCHMVWLLIRQLSRDMHYNMNICSSNGEKVTDAPDGAWNQLLIDPFSETILGTPHDPREPVTSDFGFLCLRMCSETTGMYYEGWMSDRLIVGRRTPENTGEGIWIDDSMVSKHHCMFFRRGDQIYLQDMDSTNHTWVNGILTDSAVQVSHGDHVRVGRDVYQLQFYCC